MMGSKSPQAYGGSPVLAVDLRRGLRRAVQSRASALVQEAAADGRPVLGRPLGHVKDPFGRTWTIATHKEDLTREELDERSEEAFKQMAGVLK